MKNTTSVLVGIILYLLIPVNLSFASILEINNSEKQGSLFRFDPFWKQKSGPLFTKEKDSSISLHVLGAHLSFPPVLTSDYPIIIKTKNGTVKQFLKEEGTYKVDLAGRYLIYKGKSKSILYRYDSKKKELREFVYLPEKNSLDSGDSVIRWRFQGGKLKAKEDGSIALIKTEAKLGIRAREISDNSMEIRINRFLNQQFGELAAKTLSGKTLFTIPKPMYIDASGREYHREIFYQIQTDNKNPSLNEVDNILQLVLPDSQNKSFPLWVDPTIKFAEVSPIILNGRRAGDQFGYSVASAGDFNSDGKDDVIVGVPFADKNGLSSGSAFIFFGGKTGTVENPNAKADVALHGLKASGQFGFSVSSAGDFNGDGVNDVIVGSYGNDDNGTDSGSAYIYLGRNNPRKRLRPNYTFFGEKAYEHFGFSVASAGDFNGDGRDDVVIGSRLDDSNGANAGSASVFLGQRRPRWSGALMGISSFQSTRKITRKKWTVYGKNRKDQLGFSVSSAGDFNGDGLDDIIVGAPNESSNGVESGSAYLFFGGKSGSTNDPDAAADLVIRGEAAGNRLGYSVSSAGDFNGDGLGDIIVGAPFDNKYGNSSGSAFLIFGDSNLTTPPYLYRLSGEDRQNGRFGHSVASAGDYNGDGKDDLIIGAAYDYFQASATGKGKAFIYFGTDPSFLSNLPDVVLHGPLYQIGLGGHSAIEFGYSVAAAGDFNGDGLADVIVGAPHENSGGPYSGGSAFISYGRYNGPYRAALQGRGPQDEFGFSVASAGDFNGDGLSDVIIGAYNDHQAGAAYIFLGGSSLGVPDTTFLGQNDHDWFGYSVSSAGDFNGDGMDDVIIGAPHNNYRGTFSGSTYIFFGKQTGIINTPDINADIVLRGLRSGDQFGISVSSAGNFNGDAWDDVIVGAWQDDRKNVNAGSASVYFGGIHPDVLADVVFLGQDSEDIFGKSVSSGDFNGDGKSDVLIGAPYDDNNGSASGSAFIFYGGITGLFTNPDNDANVVFRGKTDGDWFGYSVSSAGDFDGDGKDDVLIGAMRNDKNGSDSGRAYVFFEITPGTYNDPEGAAKMIFGGQSRNDRFGFSVSSAGDFNGDGKDDVVIGSVGDDNNGIRSGSAFIFFGGQTGTLDNPDTQADVILHGRNKHDQFGVSVSSAGDFNGDGRDEVIVGASKDDINSTGSGSAFIFQKGFQ